MEGEENRVPAFAAGDGGERLQLTGNPILGFAPATHCQAQSFSRLTNRVGHYEKIAGVEQATSLQVEKGQRGSAGGGKTL